MSFVKLALNPEDWNHLRVLPHLLPAVVQATRFSAEGFQFGLGDTWGASATWLQSGGPREVDCWTATTWILIVALFHGRSEAMDSCHE